jgi:hypothetical protein
MSVPSVFTLMMNPDKRRADPSPTPVDLVKMISAGLAVWVIALIATWIRYRTGNGELASFWTCVAGVGGGLLALAWAKITDPHLE